MKKVVILTLFQILYVVSFSQNNANNYLSRLQSNQNPLYSGFKGSFGVSDNGTSTYTIPIPTTPGIAGMTPQISVSYNSNGGTSILGDGWSLNGLSSITRSPNVYAIDGKTQPVLFDPSDKLQLDGQRLVLVNPNDAYGDRQTEYRTENNSFKRVTIEQVNGDPIDGISYIKVEGKDGLIYFYGDANATSRRIPQGIVKTNTITRAGIPYIWLLTEIRDRNDNWIKLKYNIIANSYRPLQISYGAKNETQSVGEINFTYWDESFDPSKHNHWGWSVEKFVQGEEIIIDKPLKTIQSLNATKEGDKREVRSINFLYSYNPSSNKLSIEKIFQTVKQSPRSDLIDDSPNAVLFEYNKPKTAPDFSSNATTLSKEQLTLEEDYKIAIGDFNGDGFPDQLMHKNYGDKINLYTTTNDKTGKFITPGAFQTINTSINKDSKAFIGDFNADGKNDLIYLTNENNSLTASIYYPQVNTANQVVGFTEWRKSGITTLPAIDNKKINYGIGDFNSDGFSDIVIYYIDNGKIKYQPLITSPNDITAGQLREVDKGDIPDDGFLSLLTDINGDGITDLFFTWTTNAGWFTKSYVFTNSQTLDLQSNQTPNNAAISTSFQQPVYTLLVTNPNASDTVYNMPTNQVRQGDFSELKNIMLADINKDGNEDLLISNTNKDGWSYYCAIGRGNGQFDFKNDVIIHEPFLYNYKSAFGDFNGDGLVDLIIQRTDETGWHYLVSYGDGKGNFSKIADGSTFTTISNRNFTYSHRYETMNVFPFAYTQEILDAYAKITNDARFKDALPCTSADHECIMKGIRLIFPVETNFYPNPNRVFTTQYTYPFTDVLKNSLNPDNDIKRIVACSYFGPQSPASGIGHFQDLIFHGAGTGSTKVTFGDYWQPYVIDLNGDGISDLLLTYPLQPPTDADLSLPHNDLEQSINVFTSLSQNQKNGQLATITHSDKSQIKLEYNSTLINNENSNYVSSLSYPFLPLTSSINTVSRVSVSDGITLNSLSATRYIFQDGIVALNGRGFIGFAKTKVINEHNNNTTVKEFYINKDFMKFGLLPLKKITTLVDNIPVSEDNYQYDFIKRIADKYFNLFTRKTSSSTFDLTGFQTSYSESEFSYDDYGNLIDSRIKRGSSGDNEIIEKEHNEYYEAPGNTWDDNWLIGRLKSSIITTSRNNIDYPSRIAEFEYDLVSGQLIKEIANKQDRDHSLTKEYTFNQYGNIETSIIYPTYNRTLDNSRITTTAYTPDHRFVTTTTDAENYITTKKYEPVQGLLQLTAFGDNSNTSTITADVIGRWQKTHTPDNVETSTELRICNDCELNGHAGYFSIQEDNVSTLPVVTYYNNAGKVIRKVNFDYKDRQINTDFEYDVKGNLIKSSVPYFLHESPIWTTNTYDRLNRPLSITLPDNSKIIHKYVGLSDTVINSKNQKTISQRNILGELQKSIDDNGFYISYLYDAYSRVLTITDKIGSQYKFVYDVYGNRIEYTNPNFLKKEEIKYDAFNRKVYSKDPNGNEKKYYYDKLDRLTKLEATTGHEIDSIVYTYIKQSDSKISGKGKILNITSYSDDHPIDEQFTYYDNGQVKNHTYKYVNFNQRLNGRNENVFLYNKENQAANTLQYTYTYDKNLVKSIIYPYTGLQKDKKFTMNYQYMYGTLIKASAQTDAIAHLPLWQLINTNAAGYETDYQLGNTIVANQFFDPKTFTLSKVSYQNTAGEMAGMIYGYDSLGNMVYRKDLKNDNLHDSIYYDNLNRIIGVKTNSYSVSAMYSDNGDLKQKVYGNERQFDFDYIINTNRLDKVKSTDLQTNRSQLSPQIEYDNYGNQVATFPFLITDKTNPIVFNQFNLPAVIGHDDNRRFYHDLNFYYGFDGSKDAVYDYDNHLGVSFIGNLSEFVYRLDKHDNDGELLYQKINIVINGKAIATFRTDNNEVNFLLKDALNTVIGIANVKGDLVESMAYDIWGLERNATTWTYNWTQLASTGSNIKNKGFLNSSFFDNYGLVDLGARMYNPITGRFISVDPLTSNQYSKTQFTNPYLYGYNSTTTLVDADGKCPFCIVLVAAALIGAAEAGGSILPWEWNSNWWKGALVGAAAAAGGYAIAGPAMFTGGMSLGTAIASGAAAGFAGGFTATIVNGGNFTQALENGFKGGVIGGATAGFTYGIGSAFQGSSGVDNYFAKASLHGINQGLASAAMGGSFEHGFIAGSFVSLAEPLTQMAKTSEERVVISAMVGGTASELGGGKFANGAMSGAMIQIYNEEPHRNIFDNLGRNRNNKLPNGQLTTHPPLTPDSYVDDDQRIWQIDTEHGHGLGTKKYLSYDDFGGSYEAVIGQDGKYITTGPEGGSYNYFDYRKGPIDYGLHVIFDWFPSQLPSGTNY